MTNSFMLIIIKKIIRSNLSKTSAQINYRSSRPELFCKKGVLRNFPKFTGKHLCQRLFFNKVAGLRPNACNVIKKESLVLVFSCEFCEISKNTSGCCFCNYLSS